ncbi:gamma-tubulin complex component gcp5 [Moniliophthora roreri]|nr:gamma-tubulin complex component gcp5 [Moniliophthora roreri]
MIPSGSHDRPNSRASQRPVSSLSQYPNRPGSSQGIASLARPLSSLSTLRPTSRASTHRPKSRQQRITSGRLLPLCQSLVNNVSGIEVEGIHDGEGEEEKLNRESRKRELVEFAVKNLSVEGATLSKASITLDMEKIDSMIRGHAEKARIRSRDTYAEALETCFKQVKYQVAQDKDLDAEIKESRLSAHLQFLLALSSPPSPSTLSYAFVYLDSLANPPPPSDSDELTWKKILEEEPFEGEHWIGVPGGIPLPKRRRDDDEGSNSTSSLSSLDSDDIELDIGALPSASIDDGQLATPSSQLLPRSQSGLSEKPLYTTYAYRKEVENLKTKQYWREDWKIDGDLEDVIHRRGTFDIGNASTLGPTLQRILPPSSSPNAKSSDLPMEIMVSMERYIYEQDAVREVLMALQGRRNILFDWIDNRFATTKTTPRFLHLSLASQHSILATFCNTCTTLQQLRSFTSSIMNRYQDLQNFNTRKRAGRITRTLEAFADAVDAEIRHLERWCADREEMMIKALAGALPDSNDGLVVSMLNTEKSLRDTFEESFDVLLFVALELASDEAPENWELPNRSPSTTTALLLNILFDAAQQRLEQGDRVTADTLMRVFVRSAEVVWNMVGRWMKNGFELGGAGIGTKRELEEEFFIESNELGYEMGVVGLLDPDFWADAYGLRDDGSGTSDGGVGAVNNGQKGIPTFLQHVALPVLEAGKSVGLLKALDLDVGALKTQSEADVLNGWKWSSFRGLVAANNTLSVQHTFGNERVVDGLRLFSVSVDQLSQLIYGYVTPYCGAAGTLIARAIVEECDFWYHLHAIEGLYLMRRGDVISDFADVLFARMDAKQNWNDFHFLNTAFADVVELSRSDSKGSRLWVQLPLVRFSYRGSGIKDKSISRTMKAIDGLILEYAIPFPLTYVFTPRNLQVYGDIFVFLFQIRRAKDVLEKILVRGERGKSDAKAGLKAFYAVRSRLSWFINALLNFFTTNVIYTQVEMFHEELKQPRSLDHMIQLHAEHLKKIQGRCLLQPKTAVLYQTIMSILDMAVSFSDTFISFSGDTTMTHDISSRSVVIKHRSRRQRRRQKNVIGLAHSISWSPDSTDESENEVEFDLEEGNTRASSFAVSMSAHSSPEGEDYFNRIQRMSNELDSHVRFVRRGVETLAGGTGDAAAAFGVLAFVLEDWDL